ncbi:ATP-grasp fold amidoligase family protein [Vannielia sp. SX4]|uniref:ATP-grasp fold amidoligase family protein n=1 Tax=Vannielia sp. SX4 TaxID=3463852 RepID=UPI004057F9F0
MRDFDAQPFYSRRPRHRFGDTFVPEFVNDFVDWYKDTLPEAETVPGDNWMTCFSELGARKFRNVTRRGVGGYYQARGVFPDFRNATDFTQMTLMNSLVAPMPRLIPADKLNVAKYIPRRYRSQLHVPRVERVFNSADEVDFSGIAPGTYYLKSNHGSEQNLRIDLPLTEKETLAKIERRLPVWFDLPYGTRTSQWWYRLIERKVFLEESLTRAPDEVVPDFRFHCINGKVALLQLDLGLGTSGRNNPIYDGALNYMPHNFLRANRSEEPLPPQAGLARDMAEAIAAPFPYVRVDIYIRQSELFLGELTFLPNAGRRKIMSDELNAYLCDFWAPMPKVRQVSEATEIAIAAE